MPPPLHTNRAEPCLQLPPTSRLNAPSLLTAWTTCRDRSRMGVETGGGQLHHRFQQGGCHCAPCRQHTVLVLGQAAITLCAGVLQQLSAELQ